MLVISQVPQRLLYVDFLYVRHGLHAQAQPASTQHCHIAIAYYNEKVRTATPSEYTMASQ